MALIFEYQHSAECDGCHEYITRKFHTQNEFANNLRKIGWSISKYRVLCPVCRKQMRNNKTRKLIMRIRENSIQLNYYK